MKLEVGMYAYSKKCRDYGIGKIVNITENGLGFKGDLIDIQYKHSEHAIEIQDIEASYNIIDILEIKDYVNGVEVINIDDEWITMSDTQVPILKSLANGMIKTIVTHEQMEQMAYKVGE